MDSTIYYIKSGEAESYSTKLFAADDPIDSFDPSKYEYVCDIEEMADPDVAYWNMGFNTGTAQRAMKTGDVVVIGERGYLRAPVGWIDLSADQVAALLTRRVFRLWREPIYPL